LPVFCECRSHCGRLVAFVPAAAAIKAGKLMLQEIDYGLAVDVLMQKVARTKQLSAPGAEPATLVDLPKLEQRMRAQRGPPG